VPARAPPPVPPPPPPPVPATAPPPVPAIPPPVPPSAPPPPPATAPPPVPAIPLPPVTATTPPVPPRAPPATPPMAPLPAAPASGFVLLPLPPQPAATTTSPARNAAAHAREVMRSTLPPPLAKTGSESGCGPGLVGPLDHARVAFRARAYRPHRLGARPLHALDDDGALAVLPGRRRQRIVGSLGRRGRFRWRCGRDGDWQRDHRGRPGDGRRLRPRTDHDPEHQPDDRAREEGRPATG